MHGDANNNMDNNFPIQGIPISFEKDNSKWHLSIKLASIGSKHAWFTCYVKSHRINTTI
jgi:hypothetical protein